MFSKPTFQVVSGIGLLIHNCSLSYCLWQINRFSVKVDVYYVRSSECVCESMREESTGLTRARHHVAED